MKRAARAASLIVPIYAAAALAVVAAPPATMPAGGRWFDDLAEARRGAAGRPIVALVVGDDETSQALLNFFWTGEDKIPGCVGVRLAANVDANQRRRVGPNAAPFTVIGGNHAPAYTVLSADGRMMGAMSNARTFDEDFRATLNDAISRAKAAAGPATQPVEAVETLLGRLSAPDAATREAAMRKLGQLRPEAAGRVVAMLENPDVAGRASAVEMLERWGAPVDGVDPWDRDSITPDRMTSLRAWAAGPATQPTTAPALLTDAVIADELNALLAAANRAAAAPVRERLAAAGEAALPAVYARLKTAASQEARNRLTALRYRLVMTEVRVAADAGLAERLADGDAARRRAAVGSFVESATPDDARLVLELFGDDDALVREMALGRLKILGGADATASLAKLLSDPEPNVRAAVLKSLAGDYMTDYSTLVDPISAYVIRETDADLIGQGIRLLAMMNSEKAIDSLTKLLDHPEWRVRAEAIDAMAARAGRGSQTPLSPQQRQAVSTALVAKLDDPEAFVVSRAATALMTDSSSAATAAMTKRVETRPELLPDFVTAVAGNGDRAKLLVPSLRKWFGDGHPAVRAMALRALAKADADVSAEVRQALEDGEPEVRAAAFGAIVVIVDKLRPTSDTVTVRGFFGLSNTTQKIDRAAWAEDFRTGKKHRPKWLSDAAPLATTAAKDLPEAARADAAKALAALGHTDAAMAMLNTVADDYAGLARIAAAAWLPPAEQATIVDEIVATADPVRFNYQVYQLRQLNSPAFAGAMWKKLADPDVPPKTIAVIAESLQQTYQTHGEANSTPARQAMAKELEAYRDHGTIPQKVVALSLADVGQDADPRQMADKWFSDPAVDLVLRRDAWRLKLMWGGDNEGQPEAIRLLADKSFRDIAVRYLAAGRSGLDSDSIKTTLRGSGSVTYGIGEDKKLEAPPGVTAEMILPLLSETDADTDAYAGYLLVMLGRAEGMTPLRSAWEQAVEPSSSPYGRLLTQAIVKRNDESLTPLLVKLYEEMKRDREYMLSDFLRMIKPMTTPGAEALRKRMAAENSADVLQRHF